METLTFFAMALVFILMIVVVGSLKKKPEGKAKATPQKKHEIIDGYKAQLQEALAPLKGDNEALKAKKSALLHQFSDELARNIFFSQQEMRQVIQELAGFEPR
jgi:F0F1-type ATP synthase membrane subunit b/b'